ncbi:HD domain-containing phosphohydrolase [Pseudomonas sp. Gutcm_11s]|uniref:HD domain-containing phosphohydrolase n=1 Tax=Pseudomonas sp. Gutcm_11s TaxID=3026088 RepID=UPI002362BF24|nr:HD domain-containing phosphohydrolase [Pseudomonas sp. Gutcm_11s]MDD0844061.1 HAMP domain-containing protein [Pseudomonas sp. Gutcm_11s]
MSSAPRGISLQLLVALAIMLSMLLLGGALAWQGYHGIERALVAAAGDAAQQFGKTINERARRLIDPAQSSIRLLAYDPVAQADNLPQRLDSLPQLVESLAANKMLSAAYVGYPNGEFLLVRRLRDPELRQRFAAPSETAFLVQSVSQGEGGSMLGEWRFYDRELSLLKAEVKADYRFDPRERPWFVEASAKATTALTHPYVFFTTREVGLTLAQRSIDGAAVIGMDASVNDLASETQDLRMTAGTEIAVVDGDGSVVAYPDLRRVIVHEGDGLRLSRITELGIPSLERMFAEPPRGTMPQPYQINGKTWYGMRVPLSTFADQDMQVLIAVPADELLAGAREVLFEQLLWAAGLIALLLLVGWLLGQRIGRPLRTLAEQVRALAGFDFSREVGVESRVSEVGELSRVLRRMAGTIRNFQSITLTLSRETQLESMLGGVLKHLVEAAGVSGGAVYLHDDDSGVLRLAADCRGSGYPEELGLAARSQQGLAAAVAQALDLRGHCLAVELNDRSHELLGILVLQLESEHERDEVREPFRRFVEELSGAAAVAIETRQLIEAQKRLLDAIIKLLADAIDAKSPYTGGHCERVPQLAQMLLDRVVQAEDGPYAEFDMSEAELYEFRIAAWLHDCGKVTSPEYVVDKATKLETLYNRIHEVRMRFEVLWRDAEVDYWQGLAGGGDQEALQLTLERRQAELQEEFAFVAQANIGGEFMKDEDVERLRHIGQRRWLRHFDDRLGISHDESVRLAGVPRAQLPVAEPLLADRPEHLVAWGERKPPVAKDDPRNVWGFDMRLPANAYNYGELYNLAIRRGTLNEEERFKINEHIVQTIIMLGTLPFPRQLRRVPTIAGSHHEKMDGTGYPRRLMREQMSVAERVMAIADIFEALTAADRPYKAPKTLSESVKILAFMARDQHIDAQLFRLFLSSGVYREYGERFLRPEQIDEVDVDYWLGQVALEAQS